VFYHSPNQKATAEKLIKKYNQENKYGSPIVTQVMPFKSFHEAEKYHKEYFKQNPEKPYCRFIISPKIRKIRKHYSDKIKNRKN
jgi:peptide-methionine (S)-S-oxide reductase